MLTCLASQDNKLISMYCILGWMRECFDLISVRSTVHIHITCRGDICTIFIDMPVREGELNTE